MAIQERDIKSLFADKTEIQRIVAEQNALMGIQDDPTATPQKARAMMAENGIRAEDNEFSCGIIAARDSESAQADFVNL